MTNDQSVVAGIDLPLIFRQVAGIPQSHAERLDGEDMTEALMGKPIARDRPLFWQYGPPFARLKPGNPRYISPSLAMRDGPWKLLMNADGSELRLYNVVADPGETEDLAEQDPERTTRMRNDLMEWYAKLGYVDQSEPVSAQ